jgi:hypothetical protein
VRDPSRNRSENCCVLTRVAPAHGAECAVPARERLTAVPGMLTVAIPDLRTRASGNDLWTATRRTCFRVTRQRKRTRLRRQRLQVSSQENLPMLYKFVSSVAVVLLALSTACTDRDCDSAFNGSFRKCLRYVDSLLPDKTGQARLYAPNGAEFTTRQALWMRGQLKRIEDACARGDQGDAEIRLTAIHDLVQSHGGEY